MNGNIYGWAICDGVDKEGTLFLGSRISTRLKNEKNADSGAGRTITLYKIRYGIFTSHVLFSMKIFIQTMYINH